MSYTPSEPLTAALAPIILEKTPSMYDFDGSLSIIPRISPSVFIDLRILGDFSKLGAVGLKQRSYGETRTTFGPT